MSHSGFYQSDYAVDTSVGTAPSMGYASTPYGVPPGGMSSNMPPPNYSTSSFDDEPPLLEELGINLDHIFMKAKLVLNPLSKFEKSFADEADMSGPVLFCLMLGLFLLLGGKVQFGQIYGQASIGCLSIYAVCNLMSKDRIDLYRSTRYVGSILISIMFSASPFFQASLLDNPNTDVFVLLLKSLVFWATRSSPWSSWLHSASSSRTMASKRSSSC